MFISSLGLGLVWCSDFFLTVDLEFLGLEFELGFDRLKIDGVGEQSLDDSCNSRCWWYRPCSEILGGP